MNSGRRVQCPAANSGPDPGGRCSPVFLPPRHALLLWFLLVAVFGAAPGLLPAVSAQQTAAARRPIGTNSSSLLFLRRRGFGPGGPASPAAALLEARARHAALLRARDASSQASSVVWQPVGPAQVLTGPWNLVSGPVTSIAADPSDASGNTLYAGTAGGGVWKSTNAAGAADRVSFAPLTDTPGAYSSALLSSLSIGAISVQPGGTGVVLAGTGDPNNATSSWYGAGILRSTDGGNTWSLIDQTAVSLSLSGSVYSFAGNAFAGFAWSTVNPGLVVAAVTQSGYGSVAGTGNEQSVVGLYYSPDAGISWQMATLQDGSTPFQSPDLGNAGGNSATAVVWNPLRRRFYAAIRFHGYYESADGITWTRLTNQPGTSLTPASCPTNVMQMGSPACPLFRAAMAVQPVTGDLFVLGVDQNNLDQGLWQDVCNLSSFGTCASPSVQFGKQIADQALQSLSGDGKIPNADYDLWLAAVPAQQDTLLLAGTMDIWRCSLANSCSWRNTTNTQTCAAAQVAPAQQGIDTTFGANGLLFFGNEGGLWRSTDGINQQAAVCSPDDAAHFQNLNGGLGSLAQIESFSEDPNNATTFLVGLGDLGTAAPDPTGGAWNQVLNGEGDGTAIDPANPDNWYATSVFGIGMNRCTEGTSCDLQGFGEVVIGASQVANDVQNIPAPWILDPQNSANVIVGTCRVWRGPATGYGWNQSNLLSGMLDNDPGTFCNGNAEIRSLAAIPNDPAHPASEEIYAGMAGVLDGGGLVPGHLFGASVNGTSAAGGTTWSDLYASPVTNGGGSNRTQFNPNGYDISSIDADPHDPTGRTVYVTIQGVSDRSGTEPLIYRTTDGGAHWLDITSNLPHAPANSTVVDPGNANIVYVALDTGVYIANNVSECAVFGASCWNVYGSGLPNAPVTGLMTYSDGGLQLLRAATWGRGIWQVGLATAGVTSVSATVSPDSLSFSSQQVQTISAGQTVTVTDTGMLNLNITSITISAGFTETDSCTGQSIAAGGNCKIQVAFDPVAAGAGSGLMTIFGNMPGGQLTVALTGTGIAPAAILLSPSALDFGPILMGASSPPQNITISNTGENAVALQEETVRNSFSVLANSCGSALPAQSSCTVSIIFTPAAPGSQSGQLSVVDALGTQIALLGGTGWTTATDGLSTTSVSFPAQQVGTVSAPQPIVLTNQGDGTVTGINVATTGDFTTVNNCGTALQGHGSCVISVSFVPTVAQRETGSLTVVDAMRTQNIALNGTGVAPPGLSALPISVNFGGLAIGSTSSPQTITVTNGGGAVVTGLTTAVTAGFSIASNSCASTLTAGGSCQIGILFSPASAGTVAGTLTLSAANIGRPLTVSLTGQGQDFSIAITGAASAVITSGQAASFALQLTGISGISGTAAMTCSGVPQNATCSFNPVDAAIHSTNTSSVTVSIVTGVATSSARLQRIRGWTRGLPMLALALPLCCVGLRRRMGRPLAALMIAGFLAAALMGGCGVAAGDGSPGGGSSSNGGTDGGNSSATQSLTPSGTYTLTFTGTMSNIVRSTTARLIVQ